LALSKGQVKNLKQHWLQDEINIKSKLWDTTKFELPYIKFQDPKKIDVNEHPFVSTVDYILFNGDYAILVSSLYNYNKHASLFKWDGDCYMGQGSVSFPRGAEE
jgi:hypothetical protein